MSIRETILEKSNKRCTICNETVYKNEEYIGTITKTSNYVKNT